jgi:holo-[acyl-carrier protein] synthase
VLRVAVDVVEVDEMAASVARLGDRYVERLFTPEELGPPPAVGAPARGAVDLAQRFAAKEAALKVLAPGGRGLDWRSIELRRTAAGGWVLRLHGTAADLAHEAGIGHISLSVSTAAGLAMAVAVGCPGGPREAAATPAAEGTEGP